MLKNPGRTLRELLEKPEIIMAPGVFDGISARAIELAGFKLGYLSGAGASTSRIGEPDIGLTTMTEIVDSARAITINANIPYICDADTGYGNVLNVIRTIHELEMAGVAAIQLEDQVAPKRCGHLKGKECISTEEFVMKIKAASREKFYEDTLIVARTDARAIYGLDEAIERGKRYIDAGADILFIEAPSSIEEVERIGKELGDQVPLLANQVLGGVTPELTATELEQMGYKIVIFPDVLGFGTSIFLRNMADQIMKEGTSWNTIPGETDSRKFFDIMGMEEWRKKEQLYKED
jgi:2-methylisocitrate lyase-like PEP mutase family enzyme